MVCVHTEANVAHAVLFKKSHENAVLISTLEILKIQKNVEQHFQDVAQKVIHDKNLDSFDDHFAIHFTQKPSLQQCYEIMSFEILYKVNPISSIETWEKISCTLCMK